jgi:hypothetical protein
MGPPQLPVAETPAISAAALSIEGGEIGGERSAVEHGDDATAPSEQSHHQD